ncbi:ABC transporter ATP-binding protein [Coriobacteriales bacterium OH1046]|nr:ABC transporter ATP-binding protein [Coriobacteriales bacterium OH1046]
MMGSARPGLLKRFLSYYRPQLHLLAMDTIAALVLATIDLAFPQILRTLTGGLFTQEPDAIRSALAYLGLGMAAMYALRFVCRWFVTSWGHVMGVRMESRMRQDLFDQYERMGFSYFDRHNIGDLMSRVSNDLFDISEAAHHGPEWIIICAIEIVGSFIILALISWRLSLALALTTALLFAYGLAANKRLADLFRDNRRKISQVNSQLEDSLAGARVVKSFANEDVESEKFARSNEAYLESKVRNYRGMGIFTATVSGFTGILYTVIVVYGGLLIADGQLTPADLATYALYVSMFLSPIMTILDFTEMFQKAKAGFERFVEVLDTVPDVEDRPGASALRVSAGRVRFEGVRFSYDGEDDVIRGLDLSLEPGKTVALVGPSGGGKSTTCALLPRFYDVRAGSITIDGQDVRDVTQRSLREAIGVVQQDVYLFDGTIGANIAYGKPGATFAEIRAAARAANIAEFVEGLPQGYDTEVGERGARLSGGQKQRIAIARVFLKNPPLLIFDEATSALDNESEHAVQEALAELASGRTTLVIAHRLSTIKDADEIVTIEDGRAVERGTHEELLALGGTYARYHRMQFGA